MSDATVPGWPAVLDDLEALIARQRTVLENGGPVDAGALADVAFVVPAPLPPLPPELADRARRALAATRTLTALAGELSADAPPPVRAPAGPRRTVTTFDRRA